LIRGEYDNKVLSNYFGMIVDFK